MWGMPLRSWAEKLAHTSIFSVRDIVEAVHEAMGYGFITADAMRITKLGLPASFLAYLLAGDRLQERGEHVGDAVEERP